MTPRPSSFIGSLLLRLAPGVFSLAEVIGTFVVIAVGEIAFGTGIGWMSLHLRRWARDSRVEITLSLLTPFMAFLVPAHLGGSGVLATMTAGLFASWNGPLLIPAATRLQGIFFWDLIVYLLEGIVFLVTGLQIRTLLDRTGMVALQDSTLAVLLTVVVVIAARFIWICPAAYIPRWLSPWLVRRDPVSPWNWLFISLLSGCAAPFRSRLHWLFHSPRRTARCFHTATSSSLSHSASAQPWSSKACFCQALFIAWVGESRR
jgi:monovalent cation/hydrogen antiporter